MKTIIVWIVVLIATAMGQECSRKCTDVGGYCTKHCEGTVVPGKMGCRGKGCSCCRQVNQCLERNGKTSHNSILWDKIALSETAINSKITEGNNDITHNLDDMDVELKSIKVSQDIANSNLNHIDDLLDTCCDTIIKKLDYIIERQAVRKVNFAYSGGTAFATNSWSHDYLPMNAFLSGGGYQGYWITTGGPPVNLWFEFPKPIRVVEYSFASRPNAPYIVLDGPSKYIFWASNLVGNCVNDPNRETLDQDPSGIPFSKNNEPKKGYFTNSKKYYCYGFEVIGVPGRDDGTKYVGISNVQYYEIP